MIAAKRDEFRRAHEIVRAGRLVTVLVFELLRMAAPFDQLIRETDRALIREVFETLDQRESTILVMRFGLDNKAPKTLREIGRKFGVTRERIRQVQELALKKMRAAMEKRDRPSVEDARIRAVAV